MSVYKIRYELAEDEAKHSRFYRALSETTALDMFKETVNNGSLTGYDPKNIEVETLEEKSINSENQD